MKYFFASILFFLISLAHFNLPQVAYGLTAREVALMADSVDTSQTSEFTTTMEIERGSQKLVRSMSIKKKKVTEGEKQYIRFMDPSDVRNTSYVTWTYKDITKDDDMWIYLPASGQTRRMSGGGKKGSFMRSDYANEDMSRREVDADEYSNLQELNLGSVPCYVIEARPKFPEKTNYAKRIVWIRKDILLPAKIEFYNDEDIQVKELIFGGYKKIQSIWTATKQRMRSLLENSQTTLSITETLYNTSISEDTFQWQNMKR